MKWYKQLHWQIIIGLILGLIFGVFAALWKGKGGDLLLMSPASIDGLPTKGRFVSVVASVDGELHIRVFNSKGRLVVQMSEEEVPEEKSELLNTLKDRLTPVPDDAAIAPDARREILDDVASIVGYAERKGPRLVNDWVAPWGTIFLRLLKLIAVPLVLTSLITGVASLSDVKKLSRMGGKTIAIYVGTTAVAVIIGLLVVNVVNPGEKLAQETRDKLAADYEGVATARAETAAEVKDRPALQPLVDMVPDNFFGSASNNRNMLQMVFFAILAGVALVRMPRERGKPALDVIDSLNHLVIAMVRMIMVIAPVGVFALIADTITTLAQDNPSQVIDLVKSLGYYAICVVVGLAAHTCLVYLVLLKLFTPFSVRNFLSGIGPAQLLAFSTSSSGATLPVTMKRCEENLGVSKEVSSFVLPLGATINMDGTALYQAVAAVFIGQAMGMEMTLSIQVTIVLTAVLASIGTAAVPGAGMVMLIVILEAIGVPGAGIALIAGVDRILDMLRTVTNVTGDATVTTIVAATEKQIREPTGVSG